MTRDWESVFTSWGTSPSATEEEKCANAERIIKKAIAASTSLDGRSISVFTQGSYRNRTNVRLDSDVDICVRCSDSIFFDVPDGMTAGSVGLSTPAQYTYSQFKNEVGTALTNYLGAAGVTRGKKAFDVHENSYRVDADVVPTFEYRRYHKDGTYLIGTAFIADGAVVKTINWPEQNYDNGHQKQRDTGRRFRAAVRILKRLRNEMADAGDEAANPIASYLIECLVWNVANAGFGHDTYRADVRWALAHLANETRTDEACREWGEVNELKYLFRGGQPWTREVANRFLNAAWDYVGFE